MYVHVYVYVYVSVYVYVYVCRSEDLKTLKKAKAKAYICETTSAHLGYNEIRE